MSVVMPQITQAPAAGAVVPPCKLAHFVLRTSRYREVVSWYKIVLAAKPVFENELLTFVTYDEEHHRVAFVNVPDLADQRAGVAGVHHIAFTYRGLGEL